MTEKRSSAKLPIVNNLLKIRIEDCRPEVIEFARFVEMVLRENDHKGTWKKCTYDYLLQKLDEEVKELHDCFWYPDSRSENFGLWNDSMPRFPALGSARVFREPADVAAVAMFIFDNLKRENGGYE